MKKIKQIFSCLLCMVLCLSLCSCKDNTDDNNTVTATQQAVGFLVYQHATTSTRYENLKADTTKITEIISISNDDKITADNFVFYVYSSDAFASGTENIKTNTSTKDALIENKSLNIRFELVLETTEALLYIIYKKPDGSVFFEFDREIKNISFSPIVQIINLDENEYINKIDVSFEKNLSVQEEYQR